MLAHTYKFRMRIRLLSDIERTAKPLGHRRLGQMGRGCPPDGGCAGSKHSSSSVPDLQPLRALTNEEEPSTYPHGLPQFRSLPSRGHHLLEDEGAF